MGIDRFRRSFYERTFYFVVFALFVITGFNLWNKTAHDISPRGKFSLDRLRNEITNQNPESPSVSPRDKSSISVANNSDLKITNVERVSSEDILVTKGSNSEITGTKLERCPTNDGRLLAASGGGLGNLMFQYASGYGIAKMNGMRTVLIQNNRLLDIFKITPDSVEREDKLWGNNIAIREKHGCAFDDSLLDLPCDKNVSLCCYLQSWKYFERFKGDIRSQFMFTSRVQKLADYYWNTMVLPAVNNLSLSVTFIAVHIRRGDKANKLSLIRNGNTVATREYILKGYQYFLKKFGHASGLPYISSSVEVTETNTSQYIKHNSTSEKYSDPKFSAKSTLAKGILFVVCSDDVDWARKVVPAEVSVVVESGIPEVDMAVLARCNHTLMTVGTFGWWVAWMVQGVTVFYKNMFTPNTLMASQFQNSLEDWVLPDWIPME